MNPSHPATGSTRSLAIIAVLLGQVVGLLGYVEPLFFPLVLAGPLITGALAAAYRVPLLPSVLLWVSAGVNMTILDWVFLREDVAFHLGLTVLMSLLAAAGYGAVARVSRRRSTASA
jgi:hypothetical protein